MSSDKKYKTINLEVSISDPGSIVIPIVQIFDGEFVEDANNSVVFINNTRDVIPKKTEFAATLGDIKVKVVVTEDIPRGDLLSMPLILTGNFKYEKDLTLKLKSETFHVSPTINIYISHTGDLEFENKRERHHLGIMYCTLRNRGKETIKSDVYGVVQHDNVTFYFMKKQPIENGKEYDTVLCNLSGHYPVHIKPFTLRTGRYYYTKPPGFLTVNDLIHHNYHNEFELDEEDKNHHDNTDRNKHNHWEDMGRHFN